MVEVSPAVVPAILVVALTLSRRHLAVVLFFVSIPLHRFVPVTAVSHSFSVPELVILVLVYHYLRDTVSDGKLTLSSRWVTLGFVGFAVISLLSVLFMVLVPPDVLVHPYRFVGYGGRSLAPVTVTRYNVTQLLLRVFFVAAVIVLSYSFDHEDVYRGIRAVVLGALIVGGIGVVYQVSVLLGTSAVADAFLAVGFTEFPYPPNFVGPLPRMYSLIGEPGRSAAFLLYALGYTVPFVLRNDGATVFTGREAKLFMNLLLSFLILSTGTTGIGGLIILLVIVIISTVAFEAVSARRLFQYGLYATGAVSVVTVVLTVAGIDLLAVVSYQFNKIMLSANSGATRLWYARHALRIAFERPLLGVGVGSHHAPIMFATVLTETGVLGLALLAGTKLYIFINCARLCLHNTGRTQKVAVALFAGGGSLVATQFLVHPIGALQQPWYWAALALPLAFVTSETDRLTDRPDARRES